MYKLTDGANYVMENPMQKGKYISTTSPVLATEFTYKQARNLLQNKKKSLSWIKSFHMFDSDSEKTCSISPNYKGGDGVYLGDNDVDFDNNILICIQNEVDSIISLSGWDTMQLRKYENMLDIGLSKYDSICSDITHALLKYKEDNCGHKPPAHKMAKIGYILDEVCEKRKKIKECKRYVQILQDGAVNKYTIGKMKTELSKAAPSEYKGRTDYFEKILELLN